MISPVTIYVPVPAGVAGRPGPAARSAAEAGAPRPDSVRPVERIAPGGRHGQPGANFRAALDDRTAEELASRRRVRPRRQDDPDNGIFEAGAARTDGAHRLGQANAKGAEPAPAKAVPTRALTAPLNGPDRPRAIDAVYRTIESFGGDIAQRGAIFDFSV
ncbi:MAG: hypothetical protein ACTSXZ_02465 [Alphaproteobacteria bacterium]